jgi:hypothetical protein
MVVASMLKAMKAEGKGKGTFILKQAMMVQRGNRRIASLFLEPRFQ